MEIFGQKRIPGGFYGNLAAIILGKVFFSFFLFSENGGSKKRVPLSPAVTLECCAHITPQRKEKEEEKPINGLCDCDTMPMFDFFKGVER